MVGYIVVALYMLLKGRCHEVMRIKRYFFTWKLNVDLSTWT